MNKAKKYVLLIIFLVLTAGTEAIRLLPPLVITYEEMDEALAVMKEVF